MAGKRQHYVPLFMLRGFASRKGKKEAHCFVAEKDREPYEPNIRNTGVETHFYGGAEEGGADDRITDAEGELANFVNCLRSSSHGGVVESDKATSLIMHLGMRTKQMRDAVTQISDAMLHREITKDPELHRAQLIESFRKDLDRFKDDAKELLRAEGKSLRPAAVLLQAQRLQRLTIQQTKNLSQEGLASFAELIGASVMPRIPEVVRKGHNNALEEYPVPTARQTTMKAWDWTVEHFHDEKLQLILGDCVCWGLTPIGRASGILNWSAQDIVVAGLPISPSHLLLGTSKTEFAFENAMISNMLSAGLSKERIFASERSLASKFSPLIGSGWKSANIETLSRVLEK